VDRRELSLLIKDYFPESALDYVTNQIISLNFKLIISKKRFSRLGVFRPSKNNNKPVISINYDLDKNLFFIVYLHEVAHLMVWNNYKKRTAPHGREWKEQYRKILIEALNKNLFPEETKESIINSLTRPNFHKNLQKKFSDSSIENSNLTRVKNLPENCIFTLCNGRSFKIIRKIRTRYKCQDVKNGKYYLVNSQAEVTSYSTL